MKFIKLTDRKGFITHLNIKDISYFKAIGYGSEVKLKNGPTLFFNEDPEGIKNLLWMIEEGEDIIKTKNNL